jgi:hypothetical protein
MKKLYKFASNRAYDQYLQKGLLSSDLVALYPEIIARFGKVKPKIELTKDAEFPQWETLYITIPTKEKFETAQEKLNDLIQKWVYNQSSEFKKAITLSIL